MNGLSLAVKIQRLQGPILVLGASGFVGSNLFRLLLGHRDDVYGTVSHFPAWRLEGIPEKHILATDLLVELNLKELIAKVSPRTVFNCVAYGGYSFQNDFPLIYQTNLNLAVQLTELLAEKGQTVYIHAGSSSEYGESSAAPSESSALTPNSHYAVSKGAASGLIHYMGKKRGLACADLRLYSVYGPYEDSSRLIPAVLIAGSTGKYPPFVNPRISRDFIFVDDVARAFIDVGLGLTEKNYGESFNVGTGKCTTIEEVGRVARAIFALQDEPRFSEMANRSWDLTDWYANTGKISREFGWQATTPFEDGMRKTLEWYKKLEQPERYRRVSKEFGLDTSRSVTAIIACYKDAQAIPVMHERLVKTFEKMNVDYEIIFVNDCSPDDTEEVIREISRKNHKVLGISHSRNFGSQSAFRSGMEMATKNACVLLDGDLQDPPEVIEKFVEKWREGYDVIYGRRIKRKAPFHMQWAYKGFYYLFNKFSYIPIPRDAGDFSLIDKRVVGCLLQFPERDLFLRGVRAYAGFRQVGVDYFRPERMFGRTTNSLLKNIGWAKKGLLAFSNTPLNILSFAGVILFGLSTLGMIAQAVTKHFWPASAPAGVTTMLIVTIFFGSLNLFALSLLGEYIAKVFEEVKQRPHFIRRSIIRDGELRDASQDVRRAG